MTLQLPLPGLSSPVGTDLTATPDLRDYPHVPGATLARHGRLIGRAGEDLVASILRRHGFVVLDLDDHSADKLLCIGDTLVGVQIKTVSHADASGAWRVQVRQGCSRGTGRRGYPAAAFDITAIAVLPENVIFFTASRQQSLRIHADEIAALRAAPLASLSQAFCTLGLDWDAPTW